MSLVYTFIMLNGINSECKYLMGACKKFFRGALINVDS
jgi:hypothetical protein